MTNEITKAIIEIMPRRSRLITTLLLAIGLTALLGSHEYGKLPMSAGFDSENLIVTRNNGETYQVSKAKMDNVVVEKDFNGDGINDLRFLDGGILFGQPNSVGVPFYLKTKPKYQGEQN